MFLATSCMLVVFSQHLINNYYLHHYLHNWRFWFPILHCIQEHHANEFLSTYNAPVLQTFNTKGERCKAVNKCTDN